MKNPNFEKRNGYIVAIVQEADTKEVLMQAYMNQKAWEKTLESGMLYLWSTSKNVLWRKGETSNNEMEIREMHLDCDGDAVLILVKVQGHGLACHLEKSSCFFTRVK